MPYKQPGRTATGSADVTVQIEPRQLQQVLMNLTLNARDTVARSGESNSISAAPTKGDPVSADITVADDAEGMSESELERVFEPYFTTKGPDGTGLGLAISREIVERNGGAILVNSDRGVGSLFTIRLPLAV